MQSTDTTTNSAYSEQKLAPLIENELVITPPAPNRRRKATPPYPQVITLVQLEELFELDLHPTEEELLQLLTSTIQKVYKDEDTKKCNKIALKRLEELVLEMNCRSVIPIRNERTLLARHPRKVAQMAKSRAEHIHMMLQRDNTDAEWAEELGGLATQINDSIVQPKSAAQFKGENTQKTDLGTKARDSKRGDCTQK